MWKDFVSLLFPLNCQSCGTPLYQHEQCICTRCRFHLPKTGFCHDITNPVTSIFLGRTNIKYATSFVYFTKGGRVQKLMHNLKYKGEKQIGEHLGKLHGLELKNSKLYTDIDIIIPVPLHKQKQRKRGYNQSEQYALGLSSSIDVPVNTTALKRVQYSETQTKKARYNRWENVNEIFKIVNPEEIKGKHILLVDDVITTGATLEACANQLLLAEGTSVSIATIAIAKK